MNERIYRLTGRLVPSNLRYHSVNNSASLAEADFFLADSTTYTIVPSGSIVYSGTAPITFTSAGGTTYTITPSGGFDLFGATSLRRTRVQVASGNIAFTGSISLNRTRSQPASGFITFSGLVNQVHTKIMPAAGSFSFTGSAVISFFPAGAAASNIANKLSLAISRAMKL